jgi:hypothetical protein
MEASFAKECWRLFPTKTRYSGEAEIRQAPGAAERSQNLVFKIMWRSGSINFVGWF